MLEAGIDDWGGVSPITADHVNPERAWPALETLRRATEEAGHVLAARLTIYPAFAHDPATWLHPELRFAVLDVSDAEGLARDAPWCSGGEVEPPELVGGPAVRAGGKGRREGRGGPVAEVLDGVGLGQEVGEEEIVTLFSARGPEVRMVAEVADELRRAVVGDAITFVYNRNINYTNVCTFKCRFCAFSKGPLSLNLRGAPYLLELDEITRRVAEAEAEGATEVCLQGGIHPDFDGDYYLHVLGAVRAASERIHIHGFTALEVTEGARRSELPLADYLTQLKEAGLKTLPGTAAEILDDDIRALICPDKVNTEEWLEAHRTAHSVGLRSNITIMFGSVEHPVSWARHMRAHPCLAAGDRWVHRVRPPALRPHGDPDLSAAQGAAGADLPRDAPHALGGPHRVPRGHRQHSGQLGEDGSRGRPSGAPGGSQRRRGHADGREHLAGGRRPARPAHGGRGARDHWWRHWAGPLVQRSTLYALPARLVSEGDLRSAEREVAYDETPTAPHQEDVLHQAFAGLATEHSLGPAQARELQAMLGSLSELTREGTSVGDLKIANAALAEMAEAFRVFRPYRKVRKITMFGSARTKPEDPVYILARDLASHMAAGRLDGRDRCRSRHHGGRARGGRA